MHCMSWKEQVFLMFVYSVGIVVCAQWCAGCALCTCASPWRQLGGAKAVSVVFLVLIIVVRLTAGAETQGATAWNALHPPLPSISISLSILHAKHGFDLHFSRPTCFPNLFSSLCRQEIRWVAYIYLTVIMKDHNVPTAARRRTYGYFGSLSIFY